MDCSHDRICKKIINSKLMLVTRCCYDATRICIEDGEDIKKLLEKIFRKTARINVMQFCLIPGKAAS